MMVKPTVSVAFATFLQMLILLIGDVVPSQEPDFLEPIKNITSKLGSNVEFSCAVTHLGSYRIMWLKKDLHKETFIAINQLKISKHPRISISMLQISDEVTQSTIYIQNIQIEDRASYECAINTNPMISRTGTLDILQLPDEILSTTSPHLVDFNETQDKGNQFSKSDNVDDSSANFTISETEEFLNSSTLEEGDAVLGEEPNDKNGSSVESGCEEIKSYWEDATDNIKEMLKNVFTSLVNFTCSFLTPS